MECVEGGHRRTDVKFKGLHICSSGSLVQHGLILLLMKCRIKTIALLCLVVSVETGEKTEKESLTKEDEQPAEPKKSAKKREKKPKGEGGFQIWTELETQRNKFMVTHLLVFFRTNMLAFHLCIPTFS